MKKIISYVVVEGSTALHLQGLVGDAIKEDWQPFGPCGQLVFCCPQSAQIIESWWQAMVKYEA